MREDGVRLTRRGCSSLRSHITTKQNDIIWQITFEPFRIEQYKSGAYVWVYVCVDGYVFVREMCLALSLREMVFLTENKFYSLPHIYTDNWLIVVWFNLFRRFSLITCLVFSIPATTTKKSLTKFQSQLYQINIGKDVEYKDQWQNQIG